MSSIWMLNMNTFNDSHFLAILKIIIWYQFKWLQNAPSILKTIAIIVLKWTSLTIYHLQKNLASFKEDKSIQVLLLTLHTGANGLNLVEANHILLVEPELNLEQEAQAISRICRIGQTRYALYVILFHPF